MGIPQRSLERKMAALGLTVRSQYSDISFEDLESLVFQITNENPRMGEHMMLYRLGAMGFKVKRQQLRDAIHSVAGGRTIAPAIKRRQYSVRAPLSLVHVDGNHKLIRYRIVVHAGVDGFSRKVYFAKASDNNRSDTVLRGFIEGAYKYGVPSRIRTDKGGENILIGQFMVAARGLNRGSFVTGKSVHNQRIERLWVDVMDDVLSVFQRKFWEMEDDRILDVDSDEHLFCLHAIFLPMIQAFLDEFAEYWDDHGLSSIKGRPSPNRLFEMGLHVLKERSEIEGRSYTELQQDIQIEEFIPVQNNHQPYNHVDSIEVPEIVVPLTLQDRERVNHLLPGTSIRLEDAEENYVRLLDEVNFLINNDA